MARREKRQLGVVLTGGPCSGKTTLVNELEACGHRVVREAARDIIESTAELPDPVAFQREVFRVQMARESEALASPSPSGAVFFDRSIADGLAYLRIRGLEPLPEIERAWKDRRASYDVVFVLALHPDYPPATYRRESLAEAIAVHDAILDVYRERHPRVVELPWAPVDARREKIDTFLAQL